MKKHIYKTLILAVLMNGFTLLTQAQDQQLVVWLRSGEKVYFNLAEQPETTYADRALTISTATMSVAYPLEQVLKYTYEGTFTGVKKLEGDIIIKQEGDIVYFSNLKSGTRIDVYMADGRKVKSIKTDKSKTAVVSLADCNAGIYLIVMNGQTYKIVKE